MTVVRVFPSNIQNFFERQAFAGAAIPGANLKAEALARAMVQQARQNAGEFNQRSGLLKESVVPIIRKSPRSGAITIGVGTTIEHGEFLEHGTRPHTISVPFVGGRPPYLLRSNGPRSKGYNPTPLRRPQIVVRHPGNPAFRWLSRAVTTVMGRGA